MRREWEAGGAKCPQRAEMGKVGGRKSNEAGRRRGISRHMSRFGLAAEVGRGYSEPANVSRARPPALSLRLATLVGYARLRSPQLDVTELDIERGFCKAGLNAPPSQKSRVGARESTANWAGSRVASSAPPHSAADETEFRETLGQTGGLPARTYPMHGQEDSSTCGESATARPRSAVALADLPNRMPMLLRQAWTC